MARVLVTRPQPGADTTAERLSALGHDVRTAPLFTVHSLQWSPPGEVIDALMVTSANAMRLSGPLPEAWRALPCYPAGEATAKAAADSGFTRIIVGDGDASALAAHKAADGARPEERSVWNACGRMCAQRGATPTTKKQK